MSEIVGRLGGPRDEEELAAELELSTPPDPEAGRWLRRHLAGSVVALTTVVGSSYRATALTGVMVASLEPPLIMVSLDRDGQMVGWLRDSGVFGLSVLAGSQQFLADRFAGLAPLAPAAFAGINFLTAETGSPLLRESIGWADCRVIDEWPTGDHTCVLGRPLAVGRGNGNEHDPLLYYLSRYLPQH